MLVAEQSRPRSQMKVRVFGREVYRNHVQCTGHRAPDHSASTRHRFHRSEDPRRSNFIPNNHSLVVVLLGEGASDSCSLIMASSPLELPPKAQASLQ